MSGGTFLGVEFCDCAEPDVEHLGGLLYCANCKKQVVSADDYRAGCTHGGNPVQGCPSCATAAKADASADSVATVLVVGKTPDGRFVFQSMGLGPMEVHGLGRYLMKTAERQMDEALGFLEGGKG